MSHGSVVIESDVACIASSGVQLQVASIPVDVLRKVNESFCCSPHAAMRSGMDFITPEYLKMTEAKTEPFRSVVPLSKLFTETVCYCEMIYLNRQISTSKLKRLKNPSVAISALR